MKAILLNEQQKEDMFNKYRTDLEKEYSDKLAKYALSLNSVMPDQKDVKPNEKLRIYYTSEAYAKIVQLVFSHTQEIGWNMVVKKYNDGYRVEDVLVYPQKASAAYVEVDLERYALWKADPDKVPDEADANLFGQGHSHVNMSTEPSGRDKQQQLDEITLLGSGFYLFQIWNKRMEINSFFYDLDNNVFYDKNDIELIIEDGNINSIEFVKESKEMLIQEPISFASYKKENKSGKKEKSAKQENLDEEDPFEDIFSESVNSRYSNGYYENFNYYTHYYDY